MFAIFDALQFGICDFHVKLCTIIDSYDMQCTPSYCWTSYDNDLLYWLLLSD